MSLRRRDFIAGILSTSAVWGLLQAGAPAQEQASRFIGDVVARWNPSGREMTLIEPFEYIDPESLSWKGP